MAEKIDTVAGRKALTPRPAPYFQRLEIGGFIGFRKLADGTGTWVVRWRNENDKQINKTLGSFDTFDNACKAAREWIEHAKGGVTEDVTVSEACKRYVTDRRSEKGDSTALDAEGRFKRHVYGTKFGKLKLSRLKTGHVTDWRNALVDVDDDEDDPDAERRAKDTANRNLATLKAALNLAYRMGLIGSTAQWDRVPSFSAVGKRRERFLTTIERKKLLAAAPPDLTKLIKALLLTAARPGEIASAKVGDLNKSGLLTLDGKTGRRTVPIAPDTLKHLAACAGKRDDSEPLLVRENGEAWTRYYWRDLLQEARKSAGLGDDVVMYSLRHCAITEMIVSGIDALSVARLAGTSIAMIQHHYGHLMKDKIAAQLAKVKMI
jgi:integrase